MSETNHEIDSNFAGRLNILRAGVLGANDGIISIAGVVIGLPVLRPISGLSFIRICSYLGWCLFYGWWRIRIRFNSKDTEGGSRCA